VVQRPKKPFDQAERDVIRTALDDTIVVEAAAGTGKTSALVERIVALIETGKAEISGVVAVTFTEKAAGELKLRIREELERARQKPTDEVVLSRLETALAQLEAASMGTIHAFCADLLRERSIDAEVDPEFRTMTEAEASHVFKDVFQLWLQEQLSEPPEGIRRSLRRQSRGNDPDGPISRLRTAAWTLAEWRDFRAPWQRDADFFRVDRLDRVLAKLTAFADATENCDNPERDNFYHDTALFRRFAREIRLADEVRPARDYDGLEGQLALLKSDWNFTRPRKGYGRVYGDEVPRADLHAQHAEVVEDVTAFLREADAHLAALLQTELDSVIDRYQKIKKRSGRLDFVDLLHLTRDLLRNHADVRAAFQERFSHIFVDEFQDTDPLQAEILLLLAAKDPAVEEWQFVDPEPGKLFLVADPKQSIYRFRRADVNIYKKVKEQLIRRGARFVQLTTNFRTVENLQQAINAAFSPIMTGDSAALQAEYVPLSPFRPSSPDQPSLIALPVPRPYGGWGRVTKTAIDRSLPDAVGAFVEWVLGESGWTVSERGGPERVPVQPQHVCLLFRRFDNFWAGDITRGYVSALEARGIRHLLIGGRSYHEREEVEAMRTALSAIEWPDDELSVFATLRGPLFAIGDEDLLEYRSELRRLHPFRIPPVVPKRLESVRVCLEVLARLHRGRNYRPVSDTINDLLETTRAHASFALRPSGDQVLANVLHLAEQARSYEDTGGISFRGFVEQLLEDARTRRTPEAPILEEGSDGVRIMTVHRAKGLEFPIVIMADISANVAARKANRYVDSDKRLCASSLAGWSPLELLEHESSEVERDKAEGARIAYVAATRARDLLVVPAIGDGPWGNASADDAERIAGWVSPLNPALYPPVLDRGTSEPAPGCPSFGADSALGRPEQQSLDFESMRPGLHRVADHEVVWWDPKTLALGRTSGQGIRQEELMSKEVDPAVVGEDLERHRRWKDEHDRIIADSSHPALQLQSVTERAEQLHSTGERVPQVQVLELETSLDRPKGPRFGSLVHAVMASIPLDVRPDGVAEIARLQARVLGADDEEEKACVVIVSMWLEHTLWSRAQAAAARGELKREAPITMREADGTIVDGVVDLAFREDGVWTVVDFKTDQELETRLGIYRRQVDLYAKMIARATKEPATPILLRV